MSNNNTPGYGKYAKLIEAVENEVGMGHGAWDCVTPEELVAAVLKCAADESTRAPDGWKLVPVELTPEMVKADPYGMGYGRLHAIWSRLLAAAPPSGEVRLYESNQVDELRSPQRPSAPANWRNYGWADWDYDAAAKVTNEN